MAERFHIQEWDMGRLTMSGFQKVMEVAQAEAEAAEAEAAEVRKEELAMKAKRARGEI
jgi:hypothetical protein